MEKEDHTERDSRAEGVMGEGAPRSRRAEGIWGPEISGLPVGED